MHFARYIARLEANLTDIYELSIKYDQAKVTKNKILLEHCENESKYLTAAEKEQLDEYLQW